MILFVGVVLGEKFLVMGVMMMWFDRDREFDLKDLNSKEVLDIG